MNVQKKFLYSEGKETVVDVIPEAQTKCCATLFSNGDTGIIASQFLYCVVECLKI